MDLVPTPSQTVGPFFHLGLTTDARSVSCMASAHAKGERVWLRCRVFDGENQPVSDAMIELWQADAEGRYQGCNENTGADPECRGFGRMATDEEGRCEFETIKPGRVPGPDDVHQAPHIAAAIFARGLLKQLFTRIYFANEPSNADDPILALIPLDRRGTLMAQPDPARPGHWNFDIHLQGEQETVFLDI
jgi:protocatechuate 3,4-dioxygenase, alpha subunit